ncbi:hypothetical protein OROGR_032377 [Orobanche gracilis]
MAHQTYNLDSDEQDPLELLPSWMNDFTNPDPWPPFPGMHKQPPRRCQPPPPPAVAFSFFCNPPVPYDFNSGCPELWRDPFDLLPSWMSDFTNPDPQPPSPGMQQQPPPRHRLPPQPPHVDPWSPGSFFCDRPASVDGPAQPPLHDYQLPHMLAPSPEIGEYKWIGGLALKTRHPCMKDRDQEDVTCGICLDDLLIINRSNIGGKRIGVLDNCRHEFHVACLEKWLIKKNMCPLCRAVAVNDNDDENQGLVNIHVID